MFDWFLRGGPVMYPLAVVSVVAVAIILERLWALRRRQYLNPSELAVLSELFAAGEFLRAGNFCRQHPGPFTSIVVTMVNNRNAPYDELRELLEDTGRHQLRHLQRGLTALGTLVAAAPLLGLLGTVLGMIRVFEAIARTGMARGELLSAGIAQALITTAAGLIIAIPTLFVHSYLESRAEQIVHTIEAATIQLLHLVRRPGMESEEGA